MVICGGCYTVDTKNDFQMIYSDRKTGALSVKAVTFLLGIPLNIHGIVQLLIILRVKGHLSKFNLLRINILLANVFILVVYNPASVYWVLTSKWYGTDAGCKLLYFLLAVSFYIQPLLLSGGTVERLLAVKCFNRKYAEAASTVAYLIIATCWMVTIALSLPQLWVFGLLNERLGSICTTKWQIIRLQTCYLAHTPEKPFNITDAAQILDCLKTRTSSEVVYEFYFLSIIFVVPTTVILSGALLILPSMLTRRNWNSIRKRTCSNSHVDPSDCSTKDSRLMIKATMTGLIYIALSAPYSTAKLIQLLTMENMQLNEAGIDNILCDVMILHTCVSPVLFRGSGGASGRRRRRRTPADGETNVRDTVL